MESFWAEFQFTEYSKILIANFALVPAPLIALDLLSTGKNASTIGNENEDTVAVTLGIYIYVTFRFAALTDQLFSKNVTLIVNRVMGLIIAAIAFEFLLDGFAAHFPELVTAHDHAH